MSTATAPVAEKTTKTPPPAKAVKAPQTAEEKAAAKAQKESVMAGDKFVRILDNKGVGVVPAKKLPPQAQGIVNLIEAAGKAGITRKELVNKMVGVIVTRQPEGRILSYYQKLIQECGAVKFVQAQPAAPVAKAA